KMTNYGTNIFLIDGDGIFDLNVDLSVIPIEALKDRFLTLGHIASRDVRLCRIDHGRESGNDYEICDFGALSQSRS
ncbi:6481_t:CDS:1, partial [Rhizophagus irregularis]